MRGTVQRRVAMHDQKAVIARILEKARANPDQIGF